ncbi:MAG TPA: outer membrane beta-barrel protein [Paludibacteraceae bacterium]|nr:outer membrane beta-barrel protein [Paludibacteraceae bacterium]HPT43370.1 outer membrane beta-barrel protein [Paludibacteraceae bacterium]
MKNRIQGLTKIRFICFCCLFVLLPLVLSAQNQRLTVNFSDLQSNDGRILVSLYKGKADYSAHKPFKSTSLTIDNGSATWMPDSISQGEYILSAFHDENVNGKLDVSDSGMPEEGFAFSNNAQPKMGPPNPQEMLFSIKENENATQTIHMIYFGIKPKELETIEVVGEKKQFVNADADKTTYQVKDNTALSTGSMRDAVRKLPGVVISPSGDLNLNGKNVSIYVDGIPSNLSGSDLKNYMDGLPANTIEKIELIENPGASYEAKANGGIINIITRNNAPDNFGGTLNLNYGNSLNHKFSPSLMLNGRNKKINWQLQSGYNWHQQDQFTDIKQTFTTFTPNVIFTNNSTQKNLNRNFYIRPMMNFRLTENSYIVFNYNFNTYNNQHTSNIIRESRNLTPAIKYSSVFGNPEANRNNEFVLKYKTMLDTLGRSLQFTGYYSNYNKIANAQSTQNLSTPLYGISTNNLNLNHAYGKVDLELPFKIVRLTAGAKYNITNAHNLGKYNFNNLMSTVFENPVYNQETDFIYHEQNIAGYVEARKKMGNLSATLGVRFEDLLYESEVASADSVVGGRITKLFPTLNLLYTVIPNINFSGKYSRKIAMPAYDQLDPNVNGYFDSYSKSAGNQNLKPNFYDNYSLSVTAFNYATLGSYLSYSKNISLLSTTVQPHSFVSEKTSNDFSNIKMYGLYISLPVPFGLITKGAEFFKQPTNMSNMSYVHFYVSCNFNQIKGLDNPGTMKPLWMYNINTHIGLPHHFTLDANWFHMFKGNFQIYSFGKPMNYWQVDLSRKFLKEKLDLTAEVTQMTAQFVKFSVPNVNTDFISRTDGVTFWVKASYRFGGFKSKEETQIEVEKKTLEGGEINVRK